MREKTVLRHIIWLLSHIAHKTALDKAIFVADNILTQLYVWAERHFGGCGHPVASALRDLAYQFNMPIHIGSQVWIGAGSVVTYDIPANSIAAGNPCRVMREISERDYEYYCHDRKIEAEELKILICNQEG